MKFLGVFHLPRDSGNSGWVVNGTRFYGSFHWKISVKNGTQFPLETFPMELRVSFTNFTRFDLFQAVHDKFGKEIWRLLLLAPSVTSLSSSSSLYECSVCHGLAPDFQTLINHNCAIYVNGK